MNIPVPNHPDTKRRRVNYRVLAGVIALSAAGAAGAVLVPGSASAIVGGEPVPVTSTPWQVSLQDGSGHFCGGSVLDARSILTAAHCVEGAAASDLMVRAGVTNRTDSTGQDRAVARIIVHPGGFDAAADMALLVLAQPLQLSANVQPIALAAANDVAGATTATVSGWGALSEQGDGSETLLAAQVPLLDDASCEAQLSPDAQIVATNELCAEGLGAGSCYGDSGGPLTVVAADGTVKLAGVVSWGVECAARPGVFAEVPAFNDWITAGVAAGADGSVHPGGEFDPAAEPDSAIDGEFGDELGDGWVEVEPSADDFADDELVDDALAVDPVDDQWTDESSDEWTDESSDDWTDESTDDWTDESTDESSDDWTDESSGEWLDCEWLDEVETWLGA